MRANQGVTGLDAKRKIGNEKGGVVIIELYGESGHPIKAVCGHPHRFLDQFVDVSAESSHQRHRRCRKEESGNRGLIGRAKSDESRVTPVVASVLRGGAKRESRAWGGGRGAGCVGGMVLGLVLTSSELIGLIQGHPAFSQAKQKKG